MNASPEGRPGRNKLKLALAIVALAAVALVFISGVVIFAYQMLRAG